jgi:hypothetical protein
MKFLKFFLPILVFISCTEKFTTLDEYANLPVKFAKTIITYPTQEFSILIPKNWSWKVEQYDSKPIILGIQASYTDTTTGFTRIISVQKYRSLQSCDDLKTEFESQMKFAEKNAFGKIVESGKSRITKYESYFAHIKSDNKKSIEMITLLLKSKEKATYYSLTASCQNEDNLKTSMSLMVACLKSFEKK